MALTALATADEPASQLERLDNGQITIGLKRESGGAIAWVSASGSEKSLVNSFDRGRLIQQSYYGAVDGSLWNGKPWRWNPVQGGDWRGGSAKLLELQTTKTTAHAKTLPKHWASGQDLKSTLMEQWIDLKGPIAHIKYRFEQKDGDDHPVHDQELPAVFVQAAYDTLVVYDGDAPWTGGKLNRSKPGWPNERRKMTEHWAAYVNEKEFGLGVYVPVSDHLTCYRYGKDSQAVDACSYFAPLGHFAITANFTWEYDVFLTVGSVSEIRERFASLALTVAAEGK